LKTKRTIAFGFLFLLPKNVLIRVNFWAQKERVMFGQSYVLKPRIAFQEVVSYG